MTKKIRLFLYVCLFSIVALYAQDKVTKLKGNSKANRQIYLLIGQSNMAGRATITDDIAGELKGVMLLNDKGEWEPAKNPLNRYSTIRKGLEMQKLGPGYGFAREILKKKPGITIGLVVNAKGGSKIDSWAEGGTFFKDAVSRTKQAIAAGGELKGICWHQGESDHNNPDYFQKAKELITAFRKEFKDDRLPFIVGETCKAESERPVNKELNKIAKEIQNTACVKPDGLKAYDGNTHFDTEGQLELGKRYATEMLSVQKKNGRK